MINLWETYGRWLMKHVGKRKKDYDWLMEQLHNTTFRWIHPMDENRAGDGEYLRYYFIQDELEGDDITFKPRCSVLEMLVAFACRIENEYIGDPSDPRPDILFDEMIHNLDLPFCMDSSEVEDKLAIWMDREFDEDGYGGICPLRNTDRNQREIEMWSQMMEYIGENHL